jgi:hypothetical protein
MDTAELFVLLGGLALIGFVLWFFFGQREEAPKVLPALFSTPVRCTRGSPAATRRPTARSVA